MKAWIGFLASAAALIGAGVGLVKLSQPTPAVWSAVTVSALVAMAVQVATFAVARAWARRNVIAGWGIGSLLRLVSLAAYAFVGVKALALTPGPALLALAAFLFVTMLVEPLFLTQ